MSSSVEASSEESSIESEYDDSDKDSIALQRRPRKNRVVDKMKDARELFGWKDGQKALAM